jgi:hypothetical protein
MYSYNIDFDRGGIDSTFAQSNFDSAKLILANYLMTPR